MRAGSHELLLERSLAIDLRQLSRQAVSDHSLSHCKFSQGARPSRTIFTRLSAAQSENYGLLFLDWQTECPFWTLAVQMFMSFNECHFILDILPGTLLSI